jgi:hypothetical protein
MPLDRGAIGPLHIPVIQHGGSEGLDAPEVIGGLIDEILSQVLQFHCTSERPTVMITVAR